MRGKRVREALQEILCLGASVVMVIVVLMLAAAGSLDAAVIYVEGEVNVAVDDGESWETAYTYLQDALSDAESGDEIWVAEGIYGGVTFDLVDGVGLYGGFAGNETSRDQRDWRIYQSILDGQSSRLVVSATDVGSQTVLDGFTVTGGHVSGNGGGMLNTRSTATIRNCTFSYNYASSHGGGMMNQDSNPLVINTRFLCNESPRGAGMNNWPRSNPTLVNVEFIGNRASVFGGGLNSWDNSHPNLVNVTFFGNSVIGGYGGGMSDHEGSISKTTSVTNCVFWGNAASVEGTEQIASEKDGAFNADRDVSYSLVEDGYPGEGNISDEPDFFTVPDPGDGDWSTAEDNVYGDLRLRPGSPGIDAGDDSAVPAGVDTDLAGNPRFDGVVDMGAYETVQAPSGMVSLHISIEGTGSGTVTVTGDDGIPVEVYGARSYPEGEVLTLEAQPNPGSFFEAWGGDVSVSERVFSLTLTDDSACTAIFGCEAPTAVITVSEMSSTVTLDGTGSYAPGLGDSIVSYSWNQTAGVQEVVLSGEESATATFPVPDPGISGEDQLWFELTVTDNHGRTATASCFLTVTSAGIILNQAPIAVALGGTVTELTEGMLTGSGSSDDAGIVSYRWRQTSGVAVTLSDTTTANPVFRAPASVGANGQVLWFELTVTDAAGLTDVDTCIVNVVSGAGDSNQPPFAHAGGAQTAYEGETVTLDGSGSSDPEGSIASWQWLQVSGLTVTLSDGGGDTPSFAAPSGVGADGAVLWFQLLVTDAGGLQAFDTCPVNVISSSSTGINGVPRARASVSDVQETASGIRVTLSAAGSEDPDGGDLMYSWKLVSGPSVVVFSDPTAEVTSFTAAESSGAYLCRLTVTDGKGLTDTSECFVDLAEGAGNETGSSGADSGGGCGLGGSIPSLILFLVPLSVYLLRR